MPIALSLILCFAGCLAGILMGAIGVLCIANEVAVIGGLVAILSGAALIFGCSVQHWSIYKEKIYPPAQGALALLGDAALLALWIILFRQMENVHFMIYAAPAAVFIWHVVLGMSKEENLRDVYSSDDAAPKKAGSVVPHRPAPSPVVTTSRVGSSSGGSGRGSEKFDFDLIYALLNEEEKEELEALDYGNVSRLAFILFRALFGILCVYAGIIFITDIASGKYFLSAIPTGALGVGIVVAGAVLIVHALIRQADSIRTANPRDLPAAAVADIALTAAAIFFWRMFDDTPVLVYIGTAALGAWQAFRCASSISRCRAETAEAILRRRYEREKQASLEAARSRAYMVSGKDWVRRLRSICAECLHDSVLARLRVFEGRTLDDIFGDSRHYHRYLENHYINKKGAFLYDASVKCEGAKLIVDNYTFSRDSNSSLCLGQDISGWSIEMKQALMVYIADGIISDLTEQMKDYHDIFVTASYSLPSTTALDFTIHLSMNNPFVKRVSSAAQE